MKLPDIYPDIKNCIIAFTPKYSILSSDKKPVFPPILGTGFFINSSGLVVTNDHVVQTFTNIPRPDDLNENDFGISGLLFYQKNGSLIDVHFDIKRIIRLSKGNKSRFKKPDIAFVELNVRDNPHMNLDIEAELKEGYEVATSGFSSGRYSLMGPDGYFQISPTLQRGIISAILPYPKPKPDAFAINVMNHGGASGSPVFSTNTGNVLGILFSVLMDSSFSNENNNYMSPTNISYAIPSHRIKSNLEKIDKNIIEDQNKPKFDHIIENKRNR